MTEETIFMKIRKYIPDRYYGFLVDSMEREAFFHVSSFEAGMNEDNPPPVPNEEVLVTVDFENSKKEHVPRAKRVRRLQDPHKLTGKIISFNIDKGYGFVQTEDELTYYLHRSEVVDGTLPMVGRECVFYTSEKVRGARASYVEIKVGAIKDE